MRVILCLSLLLAACGDDAPMQPSPDAMPCVAAPDAGVSLDADFPAIVPHDSLWKVHVLADYACVYQDAAGDFLPVPTPRQVQFSVDYDHTLVAGVALDTGYANHAEWGPIDATHLWTGEIEVTGASTPGFMVTMDGIVWTKAGNTLQGTATFNAGSLGRDCYMDLLAVRELGP